MNHRYSILTACMQFLKQSNLATTDKLRAETQLIQLKRHLLNNALPSSAACGEDAFEELLCQVRAVQFESGALPGLMKRMSDMLIILDEENQARTARAGDIEEPLEPSLRPLHPRE